MGQVSIRFTDEQEKDLRKKAQLEKKSLAEFLRYRILSDEIQEQPLSRVSIESEIDELRRSLDTVNKNLIALSKRILQDSQMNSNLVQGFFNVVIEDDETKQRIYQEAEEETKEYMSRLFKG